MRRFALFVSFFALIIVLFSSCSNFGKVMKSKDFDYKLVKADEYYAKKKYRFAQQMYEELFPVFKGTQKFEELYYKYAYCFYNLDLYMDAENLFKGYLEVFPNSSKAEEVDYMRAYCYYRQSPKIELEQVNTLKSMGMMQTFISMHPTSSRVKEASDIIDLCRIKLEQKVYRSAKLQYEIGHFRAAGIAFNDLLNDYPDSKLGDEYKLMVVKSYYRFAGLSIIDKQIERYETVISEYQDFADRFPDSKLLKEAEEISQLSQNKIKVLKNEQNTPSVKL